MTAQSNRSQVLRRFLARPVRARSLQTCPPPVSRGQMPSSRAISDQDGAKGPNPGLSSPPPWDAIMESVLRSISPTSSAPGEGDNAATPTRRSRTWPVSHNALESRDHGRQSRRIGGPRGAVEPLPGVLVSHLRLHQTPRIRAGAGARPDPGLLCLCPGARPVRQGRPGQGTLPRVPS